MKKTYLMIAAAIVLGTFAACDSSDNKNRDAENLSQYVDSVDHLEPIYTEANWRVIDEGYQERNREAEKNMAAMDAADKAKVEAAKAKYASLKVKYDAKIDDAKKTTNVEKDDYKVTLRKSLFDGKLGADMAFGWMTPANTLETYEKFVDMVEKHRDDYTKEDWDEIKILYKALDARKEQIDGDISGKDRLKIAGLKTKYKVIKGVHRPMAEKE